MLLPYRSKNPPERFPYATVSLIALNVLVYALTSDNLTVIREDAVQSLAVSHNTLCVARLFTAMFIHTSPLHLIGNMWFFWIFGTSLEGRLKPLKFLLLYFAAGISGSLLHDLVVGVGHPDQFCLGASGAIMGVAGAYLYLFPFATICVFYWVGIARMGVSELQARWVVLAFVFLDLLEGCLGADGVGHFAHLGGALAGFLLAIAIRARRDTEEYSQAQAVRTDAGQNFDILNYNELAALMEHPTENLKLLSAYLTKSISQPGGGYAERAAVKVIFDHRRLLLSHGDPTLLARAVVRFVPAGTMDTAFYLLVATHAESAGALNDASQLYRRVFDTDPAAQDSEMALYRLALLAEKMAPDKAQAAALYRQLLQRFPHTEWAGSCKEAIRRLEAGTTPTMVIRPGDFQASPFVPGPPASNR